MSQTLNKSIYQLHKNVVIFPFLKFYSGSHEEKLLYFLLKGTFLRFFFSSQIIIIVVWAKEQRANENWTNRLDMYKLFQLFRSPHTSVLLSILSAVIKTPTWTDDSWPMMISKSCAKAVWSNVWVWVYTLFRAVHFRSDHPMPGVNKVIETGVNCYVPLLSTCDQIRREAC